MTVAELIEILKTLPKNVDVLTSDGYGIARVDLEDGIVYLTDEAE